MSSFKVFDEKSIQSLLDLPAVIRSVESAYKAKAENQAEVWPMIYRKLGQAADMDIRSGWMKNKKSAMISCNDGFRPVSFLIEALEEEAE